MWSETAQVRFWLCRLPPAKCPTFLCLSFLTGKMRMKIPHGVTMKIVSAECAQHLQRGARREGGISHCRLLLLLSWSQRVTSDGPHVSSTQLAAGHVQTTHRCDYIRNRESLVIQPPRTLPLAPRCTSVSSMKIGILTKMGSH